MIRKLVVFASSTFVMIGCASPAAQTATRAPSAAPPAACGAPLPVAARAWTVEGFGGRGDTQLMMTARRPTRQCVPSAGASPNAMLGAQQ